MSMRRTNVYADAEDLALVKQAAARRGVPEAEILREGIHLAALGARVWEEPFVGEDETFDLGGRVTAVDVDKGVAKSLRAKQQRLTDLR